jgi:hypothetical protein
MSTTIISASASVAKINGLASIILVVEYIQIDWFLWLHTISSSVRVSAFAVQFNEQTSAKRETADFAIGPPMIVLERAVGANPN